MNLEVKNKEFEKNFFDGKEIEYNNGKKNDLVIQFHIDFEANGLHRDLPSPWDEPFSGPRLSRYTSG